jgi:hypothetical protein
MPARTRTTEPREPALPAATAGDEAGTAEQPWLDGEPAALDLAPD